LNRKRSDGGGKETWLELRSKSFEALEPVSGRRSGATGAVLQPRRRKMRQAGRRWLARKGGKRRPRPQGLRSAASAAPLLREEPVAEAHHGRGALAVVATAAARAHPDKATAHPHGEDAHLVIRGACGSHWLGVADGVSQWADHDVDAGEYSRNLLDLCRRRILDETVVREKEPRRGAVDTDLDLELEMFSGRGNSAPESNPSMDMGRILPKRVIEDSFRSSLATLGSSTICLVSVDRWGVMHAANIGDSSFAVFRARTLRGDVQQKETAMQWDVVYRSSEMLKFFNCPDQLGPGCPDRPARAETYRFPLQVGDVVLVSTDGLLDNLSDSDIGVLLKRHSAEMSKNKPDLSKIAHELVKEAQIVGRSETARTPFMRQCNRSGYHYTGGKLDDTTVVLGKIVEEPI